MEGGGEGGEGHVVGGLVTVVREKGRFVLPPTLICARTQALSSSYSVCTDVYTHSILRVFFFTLVGSSELYFLLCLGSDLLHTPLMETRQR